METIKLLELFSGIQSQERALRQLGIPYESIGVCDCDKDVLVASAAMRFDLEKEIVNYDFPDTETMIKELQDKNIGYSFKNQKHTITSRTPIPKLKQYYISDKLLKNLGDISKVERLPRANFVTYSSPCQSFSVAGKLAGAAKTCTKCGHKWDIDFSNPDYNYKCPVCGNASLESTTSGLLQEVQRLLSIAYEENELPEYLMLENVKNLVQKKFIGQFNAWVKWLDSIGYNTYYKVLNAKHFGVWQNRERVFAISIRKDIDTNGFTFPEPIPLTTRLKDILEHNVDEKYYLPDDRIEKILNSSFMQEKKRIQTTDVCDTLLARDWKDPKCVPVEEPQVKQIGNVCPTKTRSNPNQGRVYDKDGIAPALTTMDGGNREPMVIDEIKVVGNYMPSNHDASRVVDVDGIAPTVKENHGTVTAIAEPQVVKVGQASTDGSQCGTVYSTDHLAPTLTAGCHGYAMGYIAEEQEPFIVASRGRNPENPSDRTVGVKTEQRFEPNKEGICNCLTSVQKDSYVVEPIIYDDYNSRIPQDQDAITTLTTNCGASAERNGVKILEPVVCEERKDEGLRFFKDDCVGTLRTIDACGDKRVLEPELDFVGGIGDKDWAKDGKQLSRNYPQGSRVYSSDGIASALTAQGVGGSGGFSGLYAVKEEQPKIRWRIRKLTPKETTRLMNFTDKDYEAMAKYVSNSAIYKANGNSIVVACLIAIFSSLFLKDGYKSNVWTKYSLNYWD